MTQTYTKEQLEALRDCLCRCFDKGQCQLISKCIQPSNLIKTLAADLLSANEEIERLRAYIQKDDPCKTCTGNGCQSLYPSQCTGCGSEKDVSHKNWALKGE